MKMKLFLCLFAIAVAASAARAEPSATETSKAYLAAVLQGDTQTMSTFITSDSSLVAHGDASEQKQFEGATVKTDSPRLAAGGLQITYRIKGPQIAYTAHTLEGRLLLKKIGPSWKIVSDTLLSIGGEILEPVVRAPASPAKPLTPAAKRAEEVVQSVMDAWKKGDLQAIRGLLTRRAQYSLAHPVKLPDGETRDFDPKAAGADATYTIQDMVPENGTMLATVKIIDPGNPMSAKGALLRWRLKSEAAGWRISKMIYVGPDDVALTIFDVENPAADAGMVDAAMKMLADSMRNRPGPMAGSPLVNEPVRPKAQPLAGAISPEEFDKSWKIDLTLENVPAKDALGKICNPIAFRFNFDPQATALANKPVTINATGQSRAQLIETICQQIGAHAEYTDGDLVIAPGLRSMPVAIAGPFIVIPGRLQQFPPYGTARLQLHAQSIGLAPAVAQTFSSPFAASAAFTVLSALSGAATGLLDVNGAPLGGMSRTGAEYSYEPSVRLHGLLRNISRVSVATQLTVKLPTRASELEFKDLREGSVASDGPIKLTLQKLAPPMMSMPGDNDVVATFKLEGTTRDAITLQFADSAGHALDTQPGGTMGFIKEDELTVTIHGKPASARAVVTTEQKPVVFDLELKDLPLPLADQMPEHLDELKFDGHDAPAELAFVGMVKSNFMNQMSVKLTDFSNKPIRSISAITDCVDKDGRSLFKGITMTFGREEMSPIVMAGRTAQVTGDGCPMGTASATFKVSLVCFADGTTWPAAKVPNPQAPAGDGGVAAKPATVATKTLKELIGLKGKPAMIEGECTELTVKLKRVMLYINLGSETGYAVGLSDKDSDVYAMIKGDFGKTAVGKILRINGTVIIHQGRPVVEVHSPDQIVVIGDATAQK